jgi:hypothetical protein
MDLTDNENNELYCDGGFPAIKLCIKENSDDIEKTKREFNKNNIMSIQTILDKRRSTPFLNIINTIPNQSRSVLNDKIDIDFNPIFNLKNDINDIADLNVNNLPKMKRGIPRNKYAIQRSKSKGSKGSKSKKTKSKGSKSKKNKSKGSKGNGKKASKK